MAIHKWLWWFRLLACAIGLCVAAAEVRQSVEPRNIFAQFDQLLDEESFRQLNFVDTEDLLLGAGSPKELEFQFSQAPKVKIKELDIPVAGESKCLYVFEQKPEYRDFGG